MKLYYAPRTRSIRPRWLLEELGVPFKLVRLDLASGAQKNPDFLRINPMGKVPALEDGDFHLFESGGICLYLADRFAEKGLAPKPGTPERGQYYQWAFFALTSLEPPVFEALDEKQGRRPAGSARERATRALRVLESAISGRSFLVGDHFSAADILVGTVVSVARVCGLTTEFPGIQTYGERLSSRPAYKRARVEPS